MTFLFSLLSGLFFGVGIYLMLSRHTVRLLLGVAVLGNGVNLFLFTAGGLTRHVPPIIPAGQDVLSPQAANPLPQALILTAIVISFSLFAFLLALIRRAFMDLQTDDTEAMRLAEPRREPPRGY